MEERHQGTGHPGIEAPEVPRPRGRVVSEGFTRIRVRYCECDPMGVAHHAAYVPWLEEARTELLRASGVSYAELEAAGVFLVVTRLEVRYRRAGRYDDVLEIATRVTGGSRVKINHEYEVRAIERVGVAPAGLRDSGDDLLAVASTTLACVGRDGRVRPLPDWLAPEDGA